jgi:diguanylate cyclase (GGDEF)-like protein
MKGLILADKLSSASMRILIADDSVVSRHLLESTLRKWDYEVVIACDGNEAWEILQGANPPQLAILDWMMPGHTGPEICALTRQTAREPYTYILLLTSKTLRDDLIEGLSAGADDYVTKPFDQHELQVRLRTGRRILELQRELVEAREALRDQATHDSLTQVWNRSSILEILHRELARGARQDTPIGVVMVDLDHFKRINDTHGHLAGDAVLREASRRMLSSIRSYDSLGRYGGEEFLIILPGCDAHFTEAQAERMRCSIRGSPMNLMETTISLTASFGATTALPRESSDAEAVIRIADAALYRAKHLGRDCVVWTPNSDNHQAGGAAQELTQDT